MQTKFKTIKNRFLILLLVVVMVPCVFIFSACGKSKKPDTTPKAGDTATINDATLNSQLAKLNSYTANLSTQHSFTTTPFENGVEGNTVSQSKILATPTIFKVDGEKTAIITNGKQDYSIDGVWYSVHDDNYMEMGTTSVEPHMQALLTNLNNTLPMLINLSKGTSNYSLVYGENSTKVMTIKGNPVDELNNVLKFLKDYKDANLETFINSLFKKVTGEDFDVVSLINSVKGSIHEGNTFNDIVTYLSMTSGKNLGAMLPQFQQAYNSFIALVAEIGGTKIKYPISTEDFANSGNGSLVGGKATALPQFNVNTFLMQDILETLDWTEGTINDEVNSIITDWLRNADVSFSTVMEEVIEDIETYNSLMFYIDTLSVLKSQFVVNIEFSKNDEIRAVSIAFDGKIKTAFDEQNYNLYSCNASARLDFTNLGSTTIALPTDITISKISLQILVDKESLINNNYSFNNANYPYLDSFNYKATINEDEETILSYNKSTKVFTINPIISQYSYNAFHFVINEKGYSIQIVLI